MSTRRLRNGSSSTQGTCWLRGEPETLGFPPWRRQFESPDGAVDVEGPFEADQGRRFSLRYPHVKRGRLLADGGGDYAGYAVTRGSMRKRVAVLSASPIQNLFSPSGVSASSSARGFGVKAIK